MVEITNGYFITANWGSREETPEQLAERFFEMIESFRRIDPVFDRWVYEKGKNDLETHRDDFVEFIAKKIQRNDWRKVIPKQGYWFGASLPYSQPDDHWFQVICHAGSASNMPMSNSAIFSTANSVAPAPEVVTYQIYHSVLLAIVDAWDPVTVEANSLWLVQRHKCDRTFRIAWMRYLCPSLARQVNPPESAIVEHLPNGGLLLSATDQTVDVDNPQHVAVAEEIAAALAHIGWPTTASQT